ASGGVSRIEDVQVLSRIRGVAGIIIGKALYTGAVRLEDALAAVGQASDEAAAGPPPLRGPAKRVIACLAVRAGPVVKGVRFEGARDVGDPVELAVFYDGQGADEIMLLDIDASSEGRSATEDVVRRVAAAISAPLTVGGGIRTVDDMRRMFDAGATKVSVGSAAVARPPLIKEAADTFGARRIVLAVD